MTFVKLKNFVSKNPYTGQLKQLIPFITNTELQNKLMLSKQGYEINSKRSTNQKKIIIKLLSDKLKKSSNQLTKSILWQTGKPVRYISEQINESIKICQYYHKNYTLLQPSRIKTQAKKKTLVKYTPQGAILYFIPHQYPLLFPIYLALPQLLLGNATLIKPSYNVPYTNKLITKIFKQAGFQSGQYQHIFANQNQTQNIISNEHIKGVCFAGSPLKGSKIAQICGKNIKKSSLLLRDSNVIVIMQDSNLKGVINDMLYNIGNGFGNKKILIHKNIYNNLKQQLKILIENINFGNPQDANTYFGVQSDQYRYQQFNNEFKYVQKDRILYKKQNLKKQYASFIFCQANHFFNKNIRSQYIIEILIFNQQQQIIQKINKLGGCLSVSIYKDTTRPALFEDHISCGSIFINQMINFNPRIPLGGISSSGIGKFGGLQSIRMFSNIKTNYIN